MSYLDENGLSLYDSLIKTYIESNSIQTITLSSAPTSATTTYTKDGQTVDFKIGQFARVVDQNEETGYKFYLLVNILTTINDIYAYWLEVNNKNSSEEWVDLDLPSGNLWAKCNLGASSPEKFGKYYSFGNIDGHYLTDNSYRASSYEDYANTPGSSLTTDIPNNSTYDAARNELGSSCLIPSREDFQELFERCHIQIGEYNGVNGYYIYKTYSNASSSSIVDYNTYIFIPKSPFLNYNDYYKINLPDNDATYVYLMSSSYYGSSCYVGGLYTTEEEGSYTVDGSVSSTSKYNVLPIRPICKTSMSLVLNIVDLNGTLMNDVHILVVGTKKTYDQLYKGVALQLLAGIGSCTILSDSHILNINLIGIPVNGIEVTITAIPRPIETGYIILDLTSSDPTQMVIDMLGNTYSLGYTTPDVINTIRRLSHRYAATDYPAKNQPLHLKKISDNTGNLDVNGNTVSTNLYMMRLPFFFTRATEITSTSNNTPLQGSTIWKIEFAVDPSLSITATRSPEGEGWKQWGGNDLIGCFKASLADNKLRSIPGASPLVSKSISSFKSYANTTRVSLIKWRHHCIMGILFYAYYGYTNCQTQCGGNSTSTAYQGSNSMGMTDTKSSLTSNPSFWGLNCWWSNAYETIGNVSINEGTWTITEDDGTTRTPTGTMSASSSTVYPSKWIIGDNLDLIPISGLTGGTSTQGYCDAVKYTEGTNIVPLRSGTTGTSAGIGFILANSSTGSSSNGTTRVSYTGDIVIEN